MTVVASTFPFRWDCRPNEYTFARALGGMGSALASLERLQVVEMAHGHLCGAEQRWRHDDFYKSSGHVIDKA
jgi:hypothetical protein